MIFMASVHIIIDIHGQGVASNPGPLSLSLSLSNSLKRHESVKKRGETGEREGLVHYDAEVG